MTATPKRKEGDGWIVTEQDKEIRLTNKGCKAACSVIRSHMLTE
jgi:Mn-dependent DtxR family transcriptional regulator